MTQKCLKMVIFIACLTGMTSFVHAEIIACVTITNEETGEKSKTCHVYPSRTNWAFVGWLASFRKSFNTEQPSVGINYTAAYPSISTQDAGDCEAAKARLEQMAKEDNTLGVGVTLCTGFEDVLNDLLEDGAQRVLNWATSCEGALEIAGSATGIGAVRVLAAKSMRKLIKKYAASLSQAEKDQMVREHVNGRVLEEILGAVAGFAGAASIEQMICDQLRAAWAELNG